MTVISQHEARNLLTAAVEASSQRQVARGLGVHHNTVYGWLHGREIPRVAVLAVMWLKSTTDGTNG